MNAHNDLSLRATDERKGAYMHTAPLGFKYWPFDPRPEEINIETVLHHLATRARYNGATQHPVHHDRIFYSVLEHSVYVSWYVERVLERPDLALEAFLHDGPESFTGDLIRPLKYDPEFRAPFGRVEDLNERALAKALELVHPFPPEIKIADEAVCAAEVQQIIVRHASQDFTVGKLHDDSRVADVKIRMLPPYLALQMGKRRWNELVVERRKHRALPERFQVVA